jgi:pimeloyl-ACP methyl ester carboxylesterase
MPFVDSNGIRLYYEECGKGDPLLLLMGITARGAVWQKHVEDWSKEFRCIIPDNRGVGLSDKPAGSYSTEQMADDHAGLLGALGIETARGGLLDGQHYRPATRTATSAPGAQCSSHVHVGKM